MQRIEAYLAEDEVPDWASSLKSSAKQDDPFLDQICIGFEHATFEWHGATSTLTGHSQISPMESERAVEHFRLADLDVTFPLGKLTLITGRTGSGKSALLTALLGG